MSVSTSSNGKRYVLEYGKDSNAVPIRLCYLGGVHYDSLRRRDDNHGRWTDVSQIPAIQNISDADQWHRVLDEALRKFNNFHGFLAFC